MAYGLESKCFFMLQKHANTFILFLDKDFAIDEEEESESN
jgi:hypothetical protein